METQRLVWVMSSPVCAEVNNALQELREQHKDLTRSRQSKDLTDIRVMVVFLIEWTPFEAGENFSHSIATGIVAKPNFNIDAAKIVGNKILNKMTGECTHIFIQKKRTKQQRWVPSLQ